MAVWLIAHCSLLIADYFGVYFVEDFAHNLGLETISNFGLCRLFNILLYTGAKISGNRLANSVVYRWNGDYVFGPGITAGHAGR